MIGEWQRIFNSIRHFDDVLSSLESFRHLFFTRAFLLYFARASKIVRKLIPIRFDLSRRTQVKD
jgi:hypothetical protein